jgi:hypothetical protein
MTWRAASNTISTDGIDINDWGVTIPYGPEGQSETVTLSTWDFAGQEIYYATHQFFLSARSLYFLVFNLLSPVQSHVEFWLQSIRNAAPDSPVFIIGSHADDERCTEEYTAAMLKRCVKALRCVCRVCRVVQFVLIRFCLRQARRQVSAALPQHRGLPLHRRTVGQGPRRPPRQPGQRHRRAGACLPPPTLACARVRVRSVHQRMQSIYVLGGARRNAWASRCRATTWSWRS